MQYTLLHRAFEIGVIQQHVRRLAAEFLVHALDGSCGIPGDIGARASRSGKRHHVDFTVRRER